MALIPGEEYKNISHLAALAKRSVPELNALMEGPCIKPYFDIFYFNWLEPRRRGIAGTRARSARTNGPSLQTVIQCITFGERDGREMYTCAVPDRSNWKEADHYAELLERMYQRNCTNNGGLFFESSAIYRDSAYKILWQIIRRLIDNSRTSRHVPYSPATSSHNNSSSTENHPLVVFWKNVDDREHGWYHDSNRFDESIFYAKDPTEYETLEIFKSSISGYFQLDIPGLRIGKLYRVSYTDDGVVTSPVTHSSWARIQTAARGEDHQLTLFLETRSPNAVENLYDDDDDLDPQNPTSVQETFLTNMELRGKMDEAYVVMIRERRANDITIQDRFGQYTILCGVASMTSGSVVGDVVMQRDGNDEEAVIEAANGSSLAWAIELKGKEDGVSDTQAAAALGAKLFGEISEEEAKAFRDRERWTDNTKFQREDFEGSCTELDIANREEPKIEGMLPSLVLKKHQVVGAAWILRKLNSRFRGCCLADSVGLGKTVTTLAAVQHRYNMRQREPSRRARDALYGPPKPILIVVPSSLVMQWADEANKYLPKFKVVVYYGSTSSGEGKTRFTQKGPLTNTSPWLDLKNEENARTIIISSYGRIVSKHGPRELQKWRLSCAGSSPEQANRDFGVSDPEWPNDLRGRFEMVIIDEAHFVKSAERSNTFVALSWFQAHLKIAITATPTINKIDDFGGILGFLEPQGLWEPTQLQQWGITTDVNPFRRQFDGQPASILRCTLKCFTKYILKSKDEKEKAILLERIYAICVLKRNYASRIPFGTGIPIGDDIPPMQVRTVELKFTQREIDHYAPIHNAALSHLTKIVDDSSGKARVVFDMEVWRALSHYASWIGFEHCLEVKGDEVHKLRDSEFTIQDLIFKICTEHPALPPPGSAKISETLSWIAQWSPKIRYFSYVIAEICVKQREKMLVWVGSPWEQFLLEGYLKSVGIDVQSIYGGMAQNLRQRVVNAFHTDKSSPLILICTYMINSCGLNLHGHCRNVLLFSPASSQSVEQQAIGRCRRIGQKKPQRIWRLFLRQSWDEWTEGNALVKLLPTFMAEMNDSLLAQSDDEEAEVIAVDKFASIRRFVLVDDVLEFGDNSGDKALTPEEIAKELVKILNGQGFVRKKERKPILANTFHPRSLGGGLGD